MNRTEFGTRVQHMLQHLSDIEALESSPLIQCLPARALSTNTTPGQSLQRFILSALEELKPSSHVPPSSTQWRSYRLLQLRYVEGLMIKDLESRLNLGDRQVRREHRRAVNALASKLWNRLGERETVSTDEVQDLRTFAAQPQSYKLLSIIESVLDTFQHMLPQGCSANQLDVPPDLPYVLVDRVALRQALLTVLRKAQAHDPAGGVCFCARPTAQEVMLKISMEQGPAIWQRVELDSVHNLLDSCGIRMLLAENHLEFYLPIASPKPILVIDDDKLAFHLYHRYLTGQPYQLVGVQDSREAMQTARELRPGLILLDVLLPNVDGWEVLQTLKVNPDTSQIPVVVCSVWDEPEIALSLGADDFIKKPVLRQNLLEVIERNLDQGV